MYWHRKNLYRWVVSQKFPVDGFKWQKDKVQFDEKSIENY